MKRFLQIRAEQEWAPFAAERLMAGFDPAWLREHGPDAHFLLFGGDEVEGRCSLWWRQTPPYERERLGVIGHFAVRDAEASAALLRQACTRLAAQGCTLAVGPMDGNTWRRYRLVTERGSEPPFLLEPDNPDDWPGHFTAAGFAPLARYSSALATDLFRDDPRLPQLAERLHRQGIRIRALDPERFDEELACIYTVSVASFPRNFLYTPIAEDEFTLQYRKVQPYIRPELTLLAEHDGRAVGFLFALPDALQAARGAPIDTVIIKTVAVLPDRAHAGLGSLLVARAQAIACALGYRRAIHALMHDANISRNISGHYATVMRRYALFAHPLDGTQHG